MSEVEAKKETKSVNEKEVKVEIENGCFVCHGTGHWAREVIIIAFSVSVYNTKFI